MFFQSASTTLFADVILPLALPYVMTYGVPIDLQGAIGEGMRVEVALGKNKKYSGIVARLHQDRPEQYEVKPIVSILDTTPIVNKIQLQFWNWVARYYIATVGEVMQAALPAHLKLSAETKLVWNKHHTALDADFSEQALALLPILKIRKELTISDLKQIVGYRNVAAVIREVLLKNVVSIQDNLEPLYQPKMEQIIELAPTYHEEEKLHILLNNLEKAPKQLQVFLSFLNLSVKGREVKKEVLLKTVKDANSALKALLDKEILYITQQEAGRIVAPEITENKELILSTIQQKALYEIEQQWIDKNVVLLHGVTGSGKTEIYIQLIKNCIQQGKQAVLLLPEIGLTTQLVRRLFAYFGKDLGVYHSRFSNNERVEIWEQVQNQKYKIVIGARSALWLPFENLGLIIVDEEHDTSFKQREPAPRFHARDAAIFLAQLYSAKVLLGSATPSIESKYNAAQNKYGLVTIKERYKNVALPKVEIIAAQSLETLKNKGIKLLTPELISAIQEALGQKKTNYTFPK